MLPDSSFLIWSRYQKNLLYVAAGILIGLCSAKGLALSGLGRGHKALLIVALLFFLVEAIVYLVFLFKTTKEIWKKKKEAKKK